VAYLGAESATVLIKRLPRLGSKADPF
jgi:hypothetical protein